MSKDTDQILLDFKSSNPSKLNFAYLNINLVRNKFGNFKEIINGNVDFSTIAETKLDRSFPTWKFELEGYYSPFRLDMAKQSGGLLVYIKSSIPSRQLSYGSICDSIQANCTLNMKKGIVGSFIKKTKLISWKLKATFLHIYLFVCF